MLMATIDGKLHIHTYHYGYITLEDYVGMNSTNKLNITYLSSNNLKNLSKDDILKIIIEYIQKYKEFLRIFEIPVCTEYFKYYRYIYKKLKSIFPRIHWKVVYKIDNLYLCRGQYY